MQEPQETWVRSFGLGRSPGGENGNPLQYSRLDNPINKGVWWATGDTVAESDTTEQLSMHAHTVKPDHEMCGPNR